MKTHARTALAAVVACGALLTAVALTHDDNNGSQSAASTPPKGPYVALGDSYTSGPGIPSQSAAPTGCDRSDHNYPALVAQELRLKAADFRDMSCTGATLTDLAAPQTTDHGTNPAQLSALSARTRLVTLGIGGNDIGFSSLITKCVKAGAIYYVTGSGRLTGDDAPCRGQYVSGDTDKVRQKTETAGNRLAATLSEVKRRAPKARVYVVGYPAILPPDGKDCTNEMTIAPKDIAFLHEEQRHLNDMLRERAKAAGAGYVDTYAPSVGRDACSSRDTRWVEPLLPASAAAPVHPNARGERGMADAVLRKLGVLH